MQSPNDSKHTSALLEDARMRSEYQVESASATNRGMDPLPGEKQSMGHGLHNASESDDDSDIEIRRPMGRAARRMLGGSPKASTQQSPMLSGEEDLYSATPRKTQRKSPSPPPSHAHSSLFMSPDKPGQEQDCSDEELPANPIGSKEKLAALVAEKRAERLAKEAKEAQQRSRSAHASSDLPDDILEDSREAADPEVERIMSDAAKPTRKASKKAMLDIERETQRMVRQQALAHQMKTKKKFTTNDLFAKFNYRPAGQAIPQPQPQEGDSTGSSAPNSDVVEAAAREPLSTPPSSPPTPLDRQRALVEQGALSKLKPAREDSLTNIVDDEDDEELMSVSDMTRSSRALEVAQTPAQAVLEKKKGLRLAKFGKKAVQLPQDDSSDDELEIIRELPSHLSIFDRAKGIQKRQHTDSSAIHILKHLAHAGTDAAHSARRTKNNSRPSVNPQVLEAQLRLRAKEQARARQMERIAELKAKGIEVQTTEEREREAEEFENLLEKARQDAVDLRKAEKAADNEGKIVASDDESEDEDYYDGSENDEDDERDRLQKDGNDMVDDLADESEDEEEDDDEEEADLVEDEDDADELAQAEQVPLQDDVPQPSPTKTAKMTDWTTQTPVIGRKPRKSHVVLDDDDSDMEVSQDVVHGAPQSDEEGNDPFAAFNFGAAETTAALMSPTQAFNATMQTPTQTSQQDSLDVLAYLAPHSSALRPSVPVDMVTQTRCESQISFVPGSQLPESQRVDLAWETPAPETPVPDLNRGGSNLTIETPGWEPTQDDGLPAEWQAKPDSLRESTLGPLAEHDTQATVRLRISESPVSVPKRNRLVRGQRPAVDSSDEEDELQAQSAKAPKNDAFREMAKRRKEALTTAEMAEAQREAKQMMDEQAEESEDEYAGLGGDDFVAPENDQDREMIDSSLIDVDERQIAAHFAEKQRVADEAAASKLYKDLMTGGLRRKQANMFDLDDDEDDVALRRRQMRQREEARKRKLLLQDDNIAGLAEGKQSKGKDAFLKAIADDDERDDDVMDLSDGGEDDDTTETQTDSQPSQQPMQAAPLREVSGNKRRLEEDPADRPPAKARRTKASAFKAPASLLELQDSLSFLLEEPHAALGGPAVFEDFESENDEQEPEEDENEDDDDEVEAERQRQNDGGFAPEQGSMPPPRLPASARRSTPGQGVVDRLSLKRAASTSDGAHGRTAWAAPVGGGFKVPSLLRRATTSNTGANDRGVTISNGLSRENSGGMKIGGTKKSSLAYQARAEERKAIVEAGAKRRAANTAHIAALRRNASSGFSKAMAGQFEE